MPDYDFPIKRIKQLTNQTSSLEVSELMGLQVGIKINNDSTFKEDIKYAYDHIDDFVGILFAPTRDNNDNLTLKVIKLRYKNEGGHISFLPALGQDAQGDRLFDDVLLTGEYVYFSSNFEAQNERPRMYPVTDEERLNALFLNCPIPDLVFFPKYSIYPLMDNAESTITISGAKIDYNEWGVINEGITDNMLVSTTLKIETRLSENSPGEGLTPPAVIVGEPCPPIWSFKGTNGEYRESDFQYIKNSLYISEVTKTVVQMRLDDLQRNPIGTDRANQPIEELYKEINDAFLCWLHDTLIIKYIGK